MPRSNNSGSSVHRRSLVAALLVAWFSNPLLALSYATSTKELARRFVTYSSAAPPSDTSVDVSKVDAEKDHTDQQKRKQSSYGNLPLSFEANDGQTDPQVAFLSRGRGYSIFLTPRETVLALKNRSKPDKSDRSLRKLNRVKEQPILPTFLRMRLFGSNPDPRITGLDQLPGKSNYFIGSDSTKWRQNVTQYSKVKYEGVYSGVDVVYYGNQRQLEYDFIVSPGGHTRDIKFSLEGAQRLHIDRRGDLIVTVPGGVLTQHKPTAYQESSGIRTKIASRYVRIGKTQVGILVGTYDHKLPLVIDPVLSYSTFLGGTDLDEARSVAVDEAQNIYVVGTTASTDFPTANPFQSTNHGGDPCSGVLQHKDAVVYKLNSSGSALVYSTYLGGAGCEIAYDVAVDSSGNAYVVGQTYSNDFPVANAFQGTRNGATDAFITKLNSTGDALIYSTYLGSSSLGDFEYAQSVVVDQFGSAYMTGNAEGTDFPTTPGCFRPGTARAGSTDAFVTKFTPTGTSLEYSTLLGGNNLDLGSGIAIDSSGNAYLTGLTQSTDFPTLNAIQPALNNVNGLFYDGYITKLNATGTALIYSTYIGGTNDDHTGDIAVDSSGFAYVVGVTSSADFPTLNAFQPVFGGGSLSGDPFFDGFALKVNPAGTGLVYSTFLGGSNEDTVLSMASDSAGNVYIAGETRSTNFPKKFPLQTTLRGLSDAFLTKLGSTGALLFSTYLGGTGSDVAIGVALDSSDGNAYLTGRTCSNDYPTVNALYPYQGGCDTFVTKISGLNTYQISGRVTDANGAGLSAATLTLSGSTSGTTQTDGAGNYSFAGLDAGGSYTITPAKAPYTFVPANRSFTNLSTDQSANFTVATYTVSGSVTTAGNVPLSGVTLSLTGTQTGTTQTDANGNYSFPAVAAGGSYTLTPTKPDPLLTYSFTPATQAVNNLSGNQTFNFGAAAAIISPLYPTADAHIQDGSFANTNFGAITSIRLQTDSKTNNGKNFDGYFKFDVGAIGGNITSVKFRIFAAVSAAGSVNTAVYTVADTQWVESGTNSLTWNNKPPKSPNALPGATATINSTTLTSYDFDITAYVKNEKSAGRDVISLALHNPTASSLFVNLNSREAPTNKPQLIVTVDTGPNAAPSVSLTNPLNGAVLTGPTSINLSANASDSDGSVTKVEFFAGSTSIGVVTAAPYQMVWPNVPIGSYSLTAIATDNLSTSTVSSAVNISVNPANSLPSVSLTSPLQGTILAANSNITLNATASDDDGTISSVEFFSGSTSLGIDNTSPYSITWNNIPPGVHSLTARATDNNGGQMTSPALSVNVVWQTGFSAAADAYVKDGSTAATNFGTATELQLQQGSTGLNRESYLRFDLTAVNGIARAKLRVFGRLSDTSGTNVGVGAYSISSPTSTQWVESSITWNNKPANGTLTLMGTTTVTDNVGRWYEFDVSSHIQSEKIAGRSVVSFALKSQAASNPFITFNSREATGNRPQLVVWTTQARDALLAVGSSNLNAGDTTAKMRLESLGYTVTVKVANNNLNTVDADGKALVVVSSTCNASSVTNKFRHVVVPVVNWEFDVNDDFGMTGTTSGTDFGTTTTAQTQLSITNAGHALASGLSGTVSVVSSGSNFSWGLPNANAAKIATLMSDANKTVIFGYDGGAAMPGLEAPARRVGLFMTDLTAGSFNGNGNALFDAAVKWATEVNTTPTITTVTPGTGPVGTVVTISGSNFGQMQGTSTLSFNSMPATATSWSDRTIVAAVPSYATTGLVVVKVNGVYSNGIAFTVAEIDSDGDGLADWWELQYFGNLTQNANGDPDNDGLTNLQEYQQGRNPTKSALSDTGDFVNLRLYTPLSP